MAYKQPGTADTYTFECTDPEQVPAYSQVHYDEENCKNSNRVQMTVSSSSSSGSSQRTYSCRFIANITQPTTDEVHSENERSIETCARAHTKPIWQREKDILNSLELDMLQYMDVRSLVPLLKARGMVSQDDEEHLNGLGDVHRKKSKYILEIIPKKGDKALLLFLKCLQEEREHRGHDTLAKMLHKACTKAGYEVLSEAWGEDTSSGMPSRCASSGHLDVPIRGTPLPGPGPLDETALAGQEIIKKLEADLKVWKEVADKFIKENLELKFQNVELRCQNLELKHENTELKLNQPVDGSVQSNSTQH